jgi:hypothetical protein
VPFLQAEFKDAIQFVREKIISELDVKNKFDVYMHFCNPIRSQTGGKHVITWASNTNAIHEFGHALKFGHAFSSLSGELLSSRDPFDQMTMFEPYSSTNAPHRFMKDWFLPGELVRCKSGMFTLGQLKNFDDVSSIKVLKIDNFFISYNEKDNVNYVTLHKIFDVKKTCIIGMYKVEVGKEFKNAESDLTITVKNFSDDLVTIDVFNVNESNFEDDEIYECSDSEEFTTD